VHEEEGGVALGDGLQAGGPWGRVLCYRAGPVLGAGEGGSCVPAEG